MRIKIAASFMDIAKKKNVSKISITEIMSAAGMPRQKFYTCFEDMNDLIHWVNSFNLLEAFNNFFDYDKDAHQSYITTLTHMRENKQYYKNIIADDGAGTFETAFYNWALACAYRHIGRGRMTDKEEFCIKFYERGMVMMIIEWIRNDMTILPETMADYLCSAMPPSMAKFYN